MGSLDSLSSDKDTAAPTDSTLPAAARAQYGFSRTSIEKPLDGILDQHTKLYSCRNNLLVKRKRLHGTFKKLHTARSEASDAETKLMDTFQEYIAKCDPSTLPQIIIESFEFVRCRQNELVTIETQCFEAERNIAKDERELMDLEQSFYQIDLRGSLDSKPEEKPHDAHQARSARSRSMAQLDRAQTPTTPFAESKSQLLGRSRPPPPALPLPFFPSSSTDLAGRLLRPPPPPPPPPPSSMSTGTTTGPLLFMAPHLRPSLPPPPPPPHLSPPAPDFPLLLRSYFHSGDSGGQLKNPLESWIRDFRRYDRDLIALRREDQKLRQAQAALIDELEQGPWTYRSTAASDSGDSSISGTEDDSTRR